jgi:serine/threonine protein kinase
MRLLIVFFILYFSPILKRGLEKFYEHAFLSYYLCESYKKREGLNYNVGLSQKGFVSDKANRQLLQFIEDPEAFMLASNARLIKSRADQKLYTFGDKEPYFLLVYEQKGFFKNLFRENRAARGASGARILRDSGHLSFDTAALVVKRTLFYSKGYHLTKAVQSNHLLKEFRDSRDRSILMRIPTFFAQIKKRGLIHGDLTPENILLKGDKLVIIDTCDVHIYPKYAPLFYLRHKHEVSFCYRHFDYV